MFTIAPNQRGFFLGIGSSGIESFAVQRFLPLGFLSRFGRLQGLSIAQSTPYRIAFWFSFAFFFGFCCVFGIFVRLLKHL
jgi:hypothetical protein